MNKDIIYIDTEDDITAIIGKIKASRDKIVALVPPKRTGVLQSAVNLRLLARMAETSNKHLVIVTNNKALIALTAIAKIPVAKNLQSKPEIAEIDALEVDDGEDIIEGAQLPVGDLAKTVKKPTAEEEIVEDMGEIDIDNEAPQSVVASSTGSVVSKNSQPANKPIRSGIKVPDFSQFRKKLFIGGFAGVLLIVFLIWAIAFAPAATVIITAKTTSTGVSFPVILGGTTATDISKDIIQTVTKTTKKDVSVDFTATGKKMLGTKATGTMTLSNASKSYPISVLAGSEFSSDGYTFVTTSEVDVPGATVDDGIVPGTVEVSVTAAEVGSDYNLPAGAYLSSVSYITAYGEQMSGGTSHEAVVVTAEDVQKANEALVALSSASVKTQLTKQFANGEKVIADSFNVEHAAAVSVPEIGAEATSGKAKLTSATTYTLTAIAKSELQAYLKDAMSKQITNSKTQRIYNDGIDKVVLSGYTKNETTATVNVAATGQIGPNIDQAAIKQQVKGLRYGDVQALISDIEGVSNVDIKFSYFWVNTVPNDVNKIDVQFTVKNA